MKKLIIIIMVIFILISCTDTIKSANEPMNIQSFRTEEPLTLAIEKDYPIVNYKVDKQIVYENYWTHNIKDIVEYGFKTYVKNAGPLKIKLDYKIEISIDGFIYYSKSEATLIEPHQTLSSKYIKISKNDFDINNLKVEFEVYDVTPIY